MESPCKTTFLISSKYSRNAFICFLFSAFSRQRHNKPQGCAVGGSVVAGVPDSWGDQCPGWHPLLVPAQAPPKTREQEGLQHLFRALQVHHWGEQGPWHIPLAARKACRDGKRQSTWVFFLIVEFFSQRLLDLKILYFLSLYFNGLRIMGFFPPGFPLQLNSTHKKVSSVFPGLAIA